jgi:hypothetical protein
MLGLAYIQRRFPLPISRDVSGVILELPSDQLVFELVFESSNFKS